MRSSSGEARSSAMSPSPSQGSSGGSSWALTSAPMENDTATLDQAEPVDGELVEEELLVEEISIDGMCGVY
jgi:mycofactocin precursor